MFATGSVTLSIVLPLSITTDTKDIKETSKQITNKLTKFDGGLLNTRFYYCYYKSPTDT